MDYYFAPMEGITGYIYRNAHRQFFPGVNKYFTPFLSPNQNGKFSSREWNDIKPEHNRGLYVVPQILTNHADHFIKTAAKLQELGYREVNLNLGGPSKTVVSKNKGSGFLALKEELDRFLNEVCSRVDIKVSVKTRIGRDSPEEFHTLMEIFNKYSLEELIIHPRLQSDFYRNEPKLPVFAEGMKHSTNSVCYNGDICTLQDDQSIRKQFPDLSKIMIGRGFLINPGFLDTLNHKYLDKQRLRSFHDKVFWDYQKVLSGDRNVLFKMKEFWSYTIRIFSENKKYAKNIRKAEHFDRYEEAINALFYEQDIIL